MGLIKCTRGLNQDGRIDFSIDSEYFSSISGGVATPIAPSDGNLAFEDYNGTLSVIPITGGVRVCCDAGKCSDGFYVFLFGSD